MWHTGYIKWINEFVEGALSSWPSWKTMLQRAKRWAVCSSAGGFEPALFESAEAYIDASPNPLCIVVDVGLPGISGIELQQRLRDAGTAPPIIVTTANHEDGHPRACPAGTAAQDFSGSRSTALP